MARRRELRPYLRPPPSLRLRPPPGLAAQGSPLDEVDRHRRKPHPNAAHMGPRPDPPRFRSLQHSGLSKPLRLGGWVDSPAPALGSDLAGVLRRFSPLRRCDPFDNVA